MTPLEKAAQAVDDALSMACFDNNRTNLEDLLDAVRWHDAEIVRAMDPFEIALAGQHARDDIANRLDPHPNRTTKENR